MKIFEYSKENPELNLRPIEIVILLQHYNFKVRNHTSNISKNMKICIEDINKFQNLISDEYTKSKDIKNVKCLLASKANISLVNVNNLLTTKDLKELKSAITFLEEYKTSTEVEKTLPSMDVAALISDLSTELTETLNKYGTNSVLNYGKDSTDIRDAFNFNKFEKTFFTIDKDSLLNIIKSLLKHKHSDGQNYGYWVASVLLDYPKDMPPCKLGEIMEKTKVTNYDATA